MGCLSYKSSGNHFLDLLYTNISHTNFHAIIFDIISENLRYDYHLIDYDPRVISKKVSDCHYSQTHQYKEFEDYLDLNIF